MTVQGVGSGSRQFGRFTLDPQRRSLTANGTPVILSARAFDLLWFLVQQRHRVVSKDELRAQVWGGMAVDDNNLAVQMTALRRALGEKPDGPRFILTVPGRGYQFVAAMADDAPAAPAMPAPATAESAPAAATPVARPAAPARARVWRLGLGLALLVVVASAGWLAGHGWRAGAQAPRLSIAVLPFRDLSDGPGHGYLADAISDDLTTDLSHIPGSVVIARASADSFRGQVVPADAIGRALNVRYLLEGSLRAEGSKLHINAQLIDAQTGGHLWAQAFDVDRDLLGMARADIVRQIASALDFTLTEVEAARARDAHHGPRDAEDYYLQARSVLARVSTLEGLAEAQQLLERAVAVAPDYSDALAALGTVLVRKTLEFDNPSEAADYARAQLVTAKALALAPRNAAAITATGYLAQVDGHYEQAQASFELALTLDSSDMLARNGLVAAAKQLGHMRQMITQLQELMRVDPANPGNARRQHLVGGAYLMLGKPADALEWEQRAGATLAAMKLQETAIGWQEWRLIYLIAANELVGNHSAAVQQYEAFAKIRPNRTVWGLVAYDTRAFTAQPGHAAFVAALQAAGMPYVVNENTDFGVPAPTVPQSGGDYDATPLSVPGARRINTATMRALMEAGHLPGQAGAGAPLVLDFGHGGAVIPGAVWIWAGALADQDTLVRKALAAKGATPDTPIVVAGDGPFGWGSYNAALQLVAQGFRCVLWYRGGVGAWAHAGMPTEDRRPL